MQLLTLQDPLQGAWASHPQRSQDTAQGRRPPVQKPLDLTPLVGEVAAVQQGLQAGRGTHFSEEGGSKVLQLSLNL